MTTTHRHARPGKPRSRDWRVREADGEADAWYLQRLWHHWFGAEYDYHERSLQADLWPIAGWDADDVPMPPDAHAVIAEHDPPDRQGSVAVGAGHAILLDHDEAVDELPAGDYDPAALASDPTAWLLLNAVDPAWRGLGFGSELLQRRLEWANETAADVVVACGWERDPDPQTSRPLLSKAGLYPIEHVDEMYRETRQACPDCGIWPSDESACTCDATLWAGDLPLQIGGGEAE